MKNEKKKIIADCEENICPLCGAELEFNGPREDDYDTGCTYHWNCPECGATGDEEHVRVFDCHTNVMTGKGETVDIIPPFSGFDAPVQNWIPVTKRLPNDDDFKDGAPARCWIVRRAYNLLDIGKYEDIIEDAYWRGDGFINQSICFGLTLPHVSHWMPYTIPEPPKEDDLKVAKSYPHHTQTAPLMLPVTVFVVATANNCDDDICLSEPYLSRQEALEEMRSSYYDAGGVDDGEPVPPRVSSCELSEDGYSVHLTNNDYYYGQIKEIVLGENSDDDFDDEEDEEYAD